MSSLEHRLMPFRHHYAARWRQHTTICGRGMRPRLYPQMGLTPQERRPWKRSPTLHGKSMGSWEPCSLSRFPFELSRPGPTYLFSTVFLHSS
uniref:Uncharacterized protein n=1 Tax=Bos indicus x Bos taurus TaxID=30522 RepID=A0A4W2FFB0_BOBOX